MNLLRETYIEIFLLYIDLLTLCLSIMSDGKKNNIMQFIIHHGNYIVIYSREVIICVALIQEIALVKCFS